MTQTLLDLDKARAEGEQGMERAAKRAGMEFLDRAKAHILEHLRKNHVTSASGEALTDTCKLSGIIPPDDRAFGAVFSWLSKSGQIVKAGYCERTKGHGCAGGILWRLGK